VSSDFPQQFWCALRNWWREQAHVNGAASAASLLVRNLWSFVRESTPERRRQRYGDMEYDWEHRVNTTSGTVGWGARLVGGILFVTSWMFVLQVSANRLEFAG